MSAPAPRAMAEFAASRHGLVARSQAASFGFTPRDIRLAKERGWLTEPVRGILVLSGYPPTWEQRLAIVIATSASRPLVGDGAAARLFTLDGFDSAGPALTVLRPGRVSMRAADGIVVHQTSVLDPVDRHVRQRPTLHQPGKDSCRPWVEQLQRRCLAGVDRRSTNPPSQPDLAAADRCPPSSPGTVRYWCVDAGTPTLELGGTLPDSWFEELLRRMIDHPDIPAVTPQYVITDEDGGSSHASILEFPQSVSASRGTAGSSTSGRSGRLRTKIATYARQRAAGS